MTNQILIDGDADAIQLRIQANPTGQTQPLQTWENSDGTVMLAQVSKDGNVQLGDDLLGWSTPDALIEAHRDSGSTKPKRGFHSLGRITNLFTDLINWTVAELELLGTAGVNDVQRAFRAKLTHNNSGSSTGAKLRAGDFESINQTGSSVAPVGRAVGVRGTVTNTPSGASAYLEKAIGVEASIANGLEGNISEAAAFEVADDLANSGTIDTLYGLLVHSLTQGGTNYAIHTGQGTVHLGDHLELEPLTNPPTVNPTSGVLIYTKAADNQLYARNPSGEYELGASPGGLMPTGAMMMWPSTAAPTGWLLCAGQWLALTTYKALLDVLQTDIAADDLTGTLFTADSSSDQLLATAHALQNNDKLLLGNSGGALPTGLNNSTVYFVVNQTVDSFQVSLTQGGAAVNFSDNGTGIHRFYDASLTVTADNSTDRLIATAHGLQNNDVVLLSNSGGALPTGLGFGPYYVVNQTTDNFQVSLAPSGVAVTFSDNGTGIHRVHREFKNLDMRGRFPLGKDNMGGASANRVTAAAADSLGGAGGAEIHTLTVNEMPSHTHDFKIPGGGGGSIIDRSWNNGASQIATNSTVVNSSGGGAAHNNMPPYLTLNYIIKA